MAVTEEYMVVNGRIYCKQKNLFEKKAGKLILAGNVKQPASANVISTDGCLKKSPVKILFLQAVFLSNREC
jgi:hypothetical protein